MMGESRPGKENAAVQQNVTGVLPQAPQPAAGCPSGAAAAAGHGWRPPPARVAQLALAVEVRQALTPSSAGVPWAPPVSCPSRLQLPHSPARQGSGGAFDPFAAAEEPPGCTPHCSQAGTQVVAPPAVHRKAAGAAELDSSPPPQAARAASCALFANQPGVVQSCPPERSSRRGARPLVRLRVKRSLNGAVAAAAGSGPTLLRRSMEVGPPPQQLAGCSRKRFEEADLVSPPMPRKSSRTLLDDDQRAADLLARLQLVPDDSAVAAAGCSNGMYSADIGGSTALGAAMAWAPAVLPSQL